MSDVAQNRSDIDFRLRDPAVAKDPAAYYEELRSACPIAHTDTFGGFWLMSRHHDVRAALLDTAAFSSASGVTIPAVPPPNMLCLEQDDPEHRMYRRPMQGWFTAGRMAALEPRVRHIVIDCLDAVVADGRADLAQVLAHPVPPLVIALLFGLPEEDWPYFRESGNAFLRLSGTGDVEGATAAKDALMRYVGDCLEARRRRPTEDLMSEVLAVEVDGGPITDEEALTIAFLILGAAHETTVGGIGGLLYHVAKNPGIRDRLIAEPALITNAVEEAVRLETPLPGLGRMITTDTTVNGVTMPAGERVMLMFGAANRDPDTFDDPERFRVDRPRNPHLGFGHGIHRCVGAPLARLEMRIVLEEVLARMPDLTLEDDDAVQVDYALGRSFATLPVTWTPPGHGERRSRSR